MGWMEKIGVAPAWGRPRRKAQLEPLERLVLGPQHGLHLVRLGDEELLIGRWPSGLAVLSRRPSRTGGEEGQAWREG
ncbi:MAG: flagellar biosynthetic protein FliO [Bryobacteraceae bacterium]